ncbi:4Fe-4S binding protein [bacterium]|nr:4Fe-4S binding protein [bacterium]MBU1291081.1 4Fe-4S binding protein [bacterium]MBU1428188.1 4Fe-4S binding protein [bacterium]MBU2440221.1 4Fe-4S binding protein [bacterium]MBU4562329.1 4Fe-4S binding protein [bacterium]
MLERTGIPTDDDLEKVIPNKERLAKGPVVIIECFQKIPCDPCAISCKLGAIKPFKDINDLPQVDFDKCTGCGICISSCPGLAIFVIDENYSDEKSLIKLPHEMLPLPQKGEEIYALDRAGETVGKAKVVKVLKIKSKTNIISISVPKNMAMKIRSIRAEDKRNG